MSDKILKHPEVQRQEYNKNKLTQLAEDFDKISDFGCFYIIDGEIHTDTFWDDHHKALAGATLLQQEVLQFYTRSHIDDDEG